MLTVNHTKTNNIADWTQADLDAEIAAGNYPLGTLLADIVLPSDWNANHTFSGTLPIVNGGTGQATANNAFNAIAPTQSGNSGKFLTTNGTDTSWSIPSGSGSGLSWQEITTTSVSMVTNTGYIMNNASRVVGTLPATAAQGDYYRIAGKGAGGWQLAQNLGQTIHFDGNDTTTGIGGSLSSQKPFDALELLCITANSDFLVLSSIGNITGV